MIKVNTNLQGQTTHGEQKHGQFWGAGFDAVVVETVVSVLHGQLLLQLLLHGNEMQGIQPITQPQLFGGATVVGGVGRWHTHPHG